MSTRITTHYETSRRIEMMRKLTSEGAPPERFLPLLQLVLHSVPLHAITLENEFLYRSRWNEDNRLFAIIDELKYPAPSYVRKKGRLNDIGESVFYAALCELGSVIESRPRIGALFTIARVERANKSKMLLVPLGVVDKPYSQTPRDKTDKLVIDYLHSEITKQIKSENEYNSTIALAHHFLRTPIAWEDGFPTPGVVYPSAYGKVISSATTFNVAVSAEAFERNFLITEATVCCISNETTQYRLNEINKGKVGTDGAVLWIYTYEEMIGRAKRGLLINDAVSPSLIAALDE